MVVSLFVLYGFVIFVFLWLFVGVLLDLFMCWCVLILFVLFCFLLFFWARPFGRAHFSLKFLFVW